MTKTLIVSLIPVLLIMSFLYVNMRSDKKELNKSDFFRIQDPSASPEILKVLQCPTEINDLKFFNNKLYFKQFDTQHIVCMDSTGKEIYRYGNKTAANSSRFSFIICWDIDESGITVIDGKLNKVFVLGFNDSVIHEAILPHKLIRAARLKNNLYITKIPDPDDKDNEIFETLDIVTLATQTLPYPLPDYEHRDFTLDGFFTKAGQYGFHVCYKTGYFICFDNNGKFLYDTNSIDGTGPPEIRITHDGAKRYHPLTVLVNRSAFATENKLFILSGKRAKNDPPAKHDILDVYSVADGKYTHSFTIPFFKGQPAYAVYKSEKGFFAVHGNYIVEYAL